MDWVFQYNPKRYDLLQKLRDHDYNGWWNMRERRDSVAVGDRVFFWEAGPNAALTVLGHVTSPVYIDPRISERPVVDVICDRVLNRRVTRAEVLAVKELASLAIFRGWQGTNFLLTPEQGRLLEELVGPELPASGEQPPQTLAAEPLREISDAIHRNNMRVKAELHDAVRSMDPRRFELLVKLVLAKLGYREVSVTRYVADGGVDVRARWDIGGGMEIAVAVQVKRTKSVGRPVVQKLRGALNPHETGLLITSGVFSSEAIEEASVATRQPIGLIDGAKLIDMMVANEGLGVKETRLPALQLNLADLAPETIEGDLTDG